MNARPFINNQKPFQPVFLKTQSKKKKIIDGI